MLNSHQILPGARTKGGIKTYVDADYVVRPEVTVTGQTLSFEGSIELDGEVFDMSEYDFDMSTLDSLLPDGEYVVGVVPAYDEPADRTAAESEGVNYYIDKTALGESQLHYFLPSELEAEMQQAGGYQNLFKLRTMGVATPQQVQLVNRYSDELEKLSDPRYVGQLLVPTGLSYVMKRIFPQDNRSRRDALNGMDNQQIELFKATQGYIAAERKIFEVGDTEITGDYNNTLAKIKRAFAYESEDDAKGDVNATEIRLEYKNGDTLSSPVDLEGDDITGHSHVAVFELYQPTYMSKGHHGTNPGVYDLYTKQDSDSLGRINPIYQARDFELARTSAGRGAPLSAVCKYGYPLSVARLTKNGTSYTNGSGYTPGAIIPSGSSTPTP